MTRFEAMIYSTVASTEFTCACLLRSAGHPYLGYWLFFCAATTILGLADEARSRSKS